jgi:predicted TIM-barrel fold metal-dependent hydrolase
MTKTIDIDAVEAIDVHTHVMASVANDQAGADARSVGDVFGRSHRLSLPELADYYRERSMVCVTFTVDRVGVEPNVTNEEILGLAAKHADVIIPFASVDPARGAEGVRMAERLIADYGVRGFKFHPSTQGFFPNDRAAYPLYEVIAEHRLPALFHSGHTAVGARRPGGGGIRLKHSNPMYVDDVAVDFPEMPIILAHPSFPWQDEALSVAMHKPQVYIDLSGWAPKYFPPQLIQHANTLLKDKMLFGTDFPVLTPERWLQEFAELPIKDEVRPLILKDNAARLLGLAAEAS